MVYSQTFLMLDLLKIGLSYETILNLDEETVNRFIGVYHATLQKQQEDLESQSR